MENISKKVKQLEYEIELVLSGLELEWDQVTGIKHRLSELKKLTQVNTPFLVRPHDFHIFDIDEKTGWYRSYSTRTVTDSEGNRPRAREHMNFMNLTENYDFIPATEDELPKYEKQHRLYMDYMMWHTRSDGHGGSKGGTMEEYLETL